MIRPATLDDVPAIAAMGETFHGEAGWGDIAGYDRSDCAASLAGMVDSDVAILLVAEEGGEIVGMAGGVVFPLYFNAAHKSGQELFWYMKPGLRNGSGGMLLEAMEAAAKARGCHSWIMVALDKVSPDLTGRLYRRRGYRASEHSWIRRL